MYCQSQLLNWCYCAYRFLEEQLAFRQRKKICFLPLVSLDKINYWEVSCVQDSQLLTFYLITSVKTWWVKNKLHLIYNQILSWLFFSCNVKLLFNILKFAILFRSIQQGNKLKKTNNQFSHVPLHIERLFITKDYALLIWWFCGFTRQRMEERRKIFSRKVLLSFYVNIFCCDNYILRTTVFEVGVNFPSLRKISQ